MPLYEFECPACRTRFEELLRHSFRAEDVACPACGRRRPDRLLSSTARTAGGDGGLAASSTCGSRGRFS